MNPFKKFRPLLIAMLFIAVPNIVGSDGEIERVKVESRRLRSAEEPAFQHNQFGKRMPESLADFKSALRDWIEAELPGSKTDLESDPTLFQSRMVAKLRNADVWAPEEPHTAFGYISNLEVLRPEEYPESLVVTIGVSVPCGYDDSVYLYGFTRGSRQRLLESHDSGTHGRSISEIVISRPDEDGNRMMFIARYGVQCASCWNGLSYKIFHLGSDIHAVTNVLEGHHDLYICADYHVVLEPSQFLIELRDRSIDTGILIRTHILNYQFDRRGAHRVEPFALQAQDFVDEWLTRPWDEMAKTCDVAQATKLEQWHQTLHADYVSGEYGFVQPCSSKHGQTQVAVYLNRLAGKELPEPLAVYFVVNEEKDYRFKMLDISFTRQDGCPGESYAKPNSPSLLQPARKN